METNVRYLDLCNEIEKYLISIDFNEEQKNKLRNIDLFKESQNKTPEQQRAILSLLFFRILTNNPNINPPVNIRLSLNSSSNIKNWLDNIHLIVLPYIKNFNLL